MHSTRVVIAGLAACFGAMVVVRAGDRATTWSAFCLFDDEVHAKLCQVTDQVTPDLVSHIEFTAGTARVRFAGRHNGAWWSGDLNGRPAMGYELNRGHTAFSTNDLKTRFEWWSEGMQHGTY